MMPRGRDIRLNSVLSTLPILSVLQAIKSAHSCVRGGIHLEICLCRYPTNTSYHYYPSDELFIARTTYFLRGSPSRGGVCPSSMRRFLLRYTQRGRSIRAPCSSRWTDMPCSTSHIIRSFPPEQVDLVSFPYI